MGTFVSGLDPGKKTDPAALVVCEQVQIPDPVRKGQICWAYHVVHLCSWPLGTPYTTVGDQIGLGEQVRDLFTHPELSGSLLAVGQTGVGEPVLDILRGLRPSCAIIGLVETGGIAWRPEGQVCFHVSKYELAAHLVAVFSADRIKIARDLPLGKELAKQLATFSEKQTPKGSLTWEADRPGHKDDLVAGLSMAVWLGERQPPFRASDIGHGQPTRSRQAPLGTFLPPSMRPQRGRW